MDYRGNSVVTTAPRNPIFVVGAPRSGTTWLAKIFDSHPDVVYRHEPDDCQPPPTQLTHDSLCRLLAEWRDDQRIRTSAKRPFFRKSWRPEWAHPLRLGIAYSLLAAGRVPGLSGLARHCPVPLLGDVTRARLVVKTVRWCEGIGMAAQALPDSRTIVIIRRPCAQVHSVMRGVSQGRFELREYRTMPINLDRAIAHAAGYGIDRDTFATLPDAAKYAWDWVAFNEIVESATEGLPNVHHVLYEDLTSRPMEITRQLFAFAGLSWNRQTEAFVEASTHAEGPDGYYDVIKNSSRAANRWRREMSEADAHAVEEVTRRCHLQPHWTDMAAHQA